MKNWSPRIRRRIDWYISTGVVSTLKYRQYFPPQRRSLSNCKAWHLRRT